MDIKVEHNIPIPQRHGKQPGVLIKTLKEMRIGDSFIYPGKSISNVYVSARMVGVRIQVRTTDGNRKRVWKIK